MAGIAELVDFSPQLKHPFSALLCGSSFSGKSYFFYHMLDTIDEHSILDFVPSKILYVYEHPQPEFKYLEDKVDFLQGWSSPKLSVEYLRQHPNSLILVDDCADTHYDANFLRDFYLKHSHHLRWSIITIIHSFHDKRVPFLRSISLNTHYVIFMNSPQASDSVATFCDQRFRLNKAAKKAFLELYNYITERPYDYILVDCHPLCTDKRMIFRSSLFYPTYGKGEPLTIYIPNNAK